MICNHNSSQLVVLLSKGKAKLRCNQCGKTYKASTSA